MVQDADAEDLPEPPRLRLLRRLVTLLLVVLILAVITVAAALVIRLGRAAPPPAPTLPEGLALPPGERVEAVTLGRGWVLAVTRDPAGQERLRLFDAATGRERQVVPVAP